jgi:helix-turn-helix protein
VELLKAPIPRSPEVLVSHANAALTPRHRLKLARAVVEDGWTYSYAAAVFNVSYPTAKRWAERYRQAGEAGMADRSSRPHSSPRRTSQPMVRKIVHLRWKQRLGPVQIADRLGIAPSTVHAVLVRCRLNRLSHVDRATGEPIRRYEHDHPGSMLHVDVKKLGNIPDGGWLALRRPNRGPQEPGAHPGQAAQRPPQPEDGHGVRAHRDRRPQSRRLCRNPRR